MHDKGMGSDTLIDGAAAADILGVGKSMVDHLVRQGWLRPIYTPESRRKRLYRREEVAALAEVREQDTFDIQKIASMAQQAFAAARQMERRVELMERAFGRSAWPLKLDEESVMQTYCRARHNTQHPPDPEDLKSVLEWAQILMAVDQNYFDLLEAYSGDEECWRCFMDVGEVISLNAPIKDLKWNIEAKAVYGYLDVGNRNVRNVSFFFVRSRFGVSVAAESFRFDDSLHADMMSVLASTY